MSNQYRRAKSEMLKGGCLEYLGGKRCKVCNVNWLPICCYDFHHNKGAKEEEISKMIKRKISLDIELMSELNKCIVLCSNCHRQVTNRIIRV